jgi:ATP-dependent DNA ligase
MDLALVPPLEPMLGRLVRELPTGEELFYEPKWDGFRCLVFRCGDEVDMRSRNQRPLSRYFPELVRAFLTLPHDRFVLDGEVVVAGPTGFDFVALLQRLHPAASRVERLSRETPASYVAFDLLSLEAEDLCSAYFELRRSRLERVMEKARPPLFVTPITNDPDVAVDWLDRFAGAGVDGLVAKHRTLRYEPGQRLMVKVKRERTADCVVAGFRWHHQEAIVGSLLLGIHDDEGRLHHVGLAATFSNPRRRELLNDISPYMTSLEGHPWEYGFGAPGPVGRLPGTASRWGYGNELTWVPLCPELVCEVAYDHLDAGRFRHAARFRCWRPDRDPGSCTYAQFEVPQADELLKVLGAST